MKRIIFLLLLCPIWNYGAVVNRIVASVGSIAITSVDIEDMRDFDAVAAGKRSTTSEALRKLIEMSSLLIIAEGNSSYYMDEAELRKTINGITNTSTMPGAEQRAQLYKRFPLIYRLMIRSDKVKRALMYGEPKIKAVSSQPISPKESKAFYNKHKDQLKDSPYPKIDMLIFAVESSASWTLSKLEEVEKHMADLAKYLDSTENVKAIQKKFSDLKFTKYSGRTDLFTPDILVLQKKIPEEIIGIALQDSIPLAGQVINIPIDKGFYVPQPIPLQSTGVATYVSMKILRKVPPKQLSYEQALPRIEDALRSEKAEKAIELLIKERIREGQITLSATDNTYKKLIDSFTK